MYMIVSERGVSGASFGERGVCSPVLVYPPSPLTGSLFLVTWVRVLRRWATSFHGFAKPKTSLMP